MKPSKTSRRDFLKVTAKLTAKLTAGGGLLAAWPGAGAVRAAPADPAPNIVIVLADDHTGRDCGCYGNKDVRTPNIDRLATQGMVFNNAFTSAAMCTPTRAQLYTGVFPVRNGAYPNHSKCQTGARSIVHHLKALGYRVGITGKNDQRPGDVFPFEQTHNIGNFINRSAREPYCLIFASNHPHWDWPEPDGYDPARLTVPPYMVDNPETRLALASYYTEVTQLDAEVGQCLAEVEKSGAADHTIFIYTSEQGSTFPFAKWTCYDLGLKTAMIVRWPKRVRAGSSSAALVQYVDVVPTLVEAAGGNPGRCDTGLPGAPDGGRGFDGRSFLKVLLGQSDQHDEYVYGVHTTAGIIRGSPYPVRSIRSATHKYIWNLTPEATFKNAVTDLNHGGCWNAWVRDAAANPFAAERVKMYQHRPAEEFYDVVNDPYELHNLADKPECRAPMDAMRRKLEAWMEQQGDKGVATELGVKAARQGGGQDAGE